MAPGRIGGVRGMKDVTRRMEKRAVAPLVLGGAGLALAVAIVVLVVKVRSAPPAPSVSPGEAVRSHTSAERPPAEARTRAPTVQPREQPQEPEVAEPEAAADSPQTIAEKMTEANRLYDRGDYEAAAQMAKEVLKSQPQNVKVLRIAASTACILGDGNEARVYYDQLPERDQQQIARRCRRYGIEF
jgi:regulator of protease activity HflC (stomatin/prohibitin superfamily)